MVHVVFMVGVLLAHVGGPFRRVSAGPVSFELPASWRRGNQQGSTRFETSDGGAYVIVDVNPVETQGLSGEECLQRILKKLPDGAKWRPAKASSLPMAEFVAFDYSANAEELIRTTQWVGCNGSVALAITMQLEISVNQYYGAVGEHLLETLRIDADGALEKSP
ncbi:MAG: hypothetical protein ACKVPX_18035 [Myxococcaceae bacterium]